MIGIIEPIIKLYGFTLETNQLPLKQNRFSSQPAMWFIDADVDPPVTTRKGKVYNRAQSYILIQSIWNKREIIVREETHKAIEELVKLITMDL